MRIPEIQDYLVDHYHGQNRETAVMMLGPPGIGKSVAGAEGAERIADMVDLPFVEYSDQKGEMIMNSDEKYFVYHSLPLVECEPSDLVGIPRDRDNGYVKFKPLLWARVMAENPGILMLDDFLDVQRYDLFSAAYKITLERRAGYLKLSDGVMVVGASNTPEESPLSQMLPAPLAQSITTFSSRSKFETLLLMAFLYGFVAFTFSESPISFHLTRLPPSLMIFSSSLSFSLTNPAPSSSQNFTPLYSGGL